MELINKANIWSSSVKWRKIGSFDEGDGYFRLVKGWDTWVLPENQVGVKALTNTLEGFVIEEDLNNDDTRQVWKKGPTNWEGFFTLIPYSSFGTQLLTAISGTEIRTEGT